MKKLFNTNFYVSKKVFTSHLFRRLRKNLLLLFSLACLPAFILLSGCKKQLPDAQENVANTDKMVLASEEDFTNAYQEPGESEVTYNSNRHWFFSRTFWELLSARAATAKYRNIERAFSDGYEDINFIIIVRLKIA